MKIFHAWSRPYIYIVYKKVWTQLNESLPRKYNFHLNLYNVTVNLKTGQEPWNSYEQYCSTKIIIMQSVKDLYLIANEKLKHLGFCHKR